MKTLTSANSVFALAITGLYPSPQILKGYTTDDAFTSEVVENAETMQGLDGRLSAGFIFNPTKQLITLQADSDSLDVFNNWVLAMKATREVLVANASVYLPAINKKYVMTRGFLTSHTAIPDVKKLLQPVKYQITWEQVAGASV